VVKWQEVTSIFLINLARLFMMMTDNHVVSEVVDLHDKEWQPCFKTPRKFIPLDGKPAFTKVSWKPSLKFTDLMEHSLKGHADNVMYLKAADLD